MSDIQERLSSWSEEDKRKLSSMWRTRAPVKDIAKAINKSHQEIYEQAREMDLPVRSMATNYSKDVAKRKCLSCDKDFLSEHKFNRICMSCKNKFSAGDHYAFT